LGVGSLRRRDRSMIGPDAKELAQHRSWPLSPLCTRRFASASSAAPFATLKVSSARQLMSNKQPQQSPKLLA
jgi:hypothetical protein